MSPLSVVGLKFITEQSIRSAPCGEKFAPNYLRALAAPAHLCRLKFMTSGFYTIGRVLASLATTVVRRLVLLWCCVSGIVVRNLVILVLAGWAPGRVTCFNSCRNGVLICGCLYCSRVGAVCLASGVACFLGIGYLNGPVAG